MNLLSPWNLLWLGLVAPLVLLYVLRRRRVERVVGSTLLWQAALRDLRAERPWKRLVTSVALLLQLLALIAGAIALARPAGAGGVPAGATLALVVDVSPSMGARDGERRRLDRARALGRELARAMPPGGRMMVVAAGPEPIVLAPPTADGASLARALDALQLRGGAADLEGATSLAAERLRDAPAGSHVVLVTDGAEDGELALVGRVVPVEVRLVGPGAGAPTDNVAIVDADARPRAGEGSDRADVFARLRNFGDAPADVFLTASLEGREGAVASRRLTLAPGANEAVVMAATLPPDPHGRAAVVRVALSRPGATREGLGDDLDLDDVAVVPSPGARRLPVFLVGAAPAPVERVLRADPEVELFGTSLAALAARDADAPALDGFFVYAGEVPADPPRGDSLVVAPHGPRVFELTLGEEAAGPALVTWDESDPRLRFVGLSDVHLARARPIVGGRPLVEAQIGSVISVVERPSGETLLLAFDPATSDWPRQPSFVVFFRNLLERARQRRAEGGVAPGPLGDPLRIPAPDGARVEVESPSGARFEGRSRGGVAVVPVDAAPGVYRVRQNDWQPRELHALRNLLDARESDVRARLRFTAADGEARVAQASPLDHRESWPWIVALLLALLVAEAWWASRKGAVA